MNFRVFSSQVISYHTLFPIGLVIVQNFETSRQRSILIFRKTFMWTDLVTSLDNFWFVPLYTYIVSATQLDSPSTNLLLLIPVRQSIKSAMRHTSLKMIGHQRIRHALHKIGNYHNKNRVVMSKHSSRIHIHRRALTIVNVHLNAGKTRTFD